MNTIYGCTSGCESLSCGKDCYATRSGENQQCHCVCQDHSHDPCKGGSSCFGDQWANCPQLVKRFPEHTCTKLKEPCCMSCQKKNQKIIDPRCPDGDLNLACGWRIHRNPYYECSPLKKQQQCCLSCLAVKMDPRCPNGETSPSCASWIRQVGKAAICRSVPDKCCNSCL